MLFRYSTWRPFVYFMLVGAFILILSGCGTSTTATTDSTDNPAGPGTTDTTSGTTSGTTTSTASGTQTTTSSGTGNKSPAATLKASVSSVSPSTEVEITADAIDPDGDLLSYTWTASGGTFISQTSNKAKWQAPASPGSAEISCKVEDRKGGSASPKLLMSVIGGRTYSAEVLISRYSLLADGSNTTSTDTSEWAPAANAQLTFSNINQTTITDSTGKISLDLDSKAKTASGSEVIVKYQTIEVRYTAVFMTSGTSQVDKIQLYPGYEGISVAVARGDSFSSKRGAVDVKAVESVNGSLKSLSQVSVEVGANQKVASNGEISFSVVDSSADTWVNIRKSGYAPKEDLRVPVAVDGLTIVQAQMNTQGSTPSTEATISWTKPYNGQKVFPVNGPFEVGFAQPMETSTIFNDLEMTLQNSSGQSVLVLNGALISTFFNIDWSNSRILTLTPKTALPELRKYSMHVTRWGARATDGRILKSYSSLFGNFTTDSDQAPKVVSTSPRNGDKDIALAGPFTVKFDRPMNTATLYQNLQLEVTDVKNALKVTIDQGSLDTVFSVKWADGDTTLSLVPRRMLKPLNTYLVRLVKSGFKSKTGKVLESMDGLWGQFITGSL